MQPYITPVFLLAAYSEGIFPMARSADATELDWCDPRMRGVFPLGAFLISRSLRRSILKGGFEVTVDTDFAATIRACANRETTWLSHELIGLYEQLHRMGHGHSVEVRRGGTLVGGVFGVTLGAAFFGESMFSTVTDASKVALAWTVHRLRAGGFKLFDTQFITAHLASLGAEEIPRAEYRRQLEAAVNGRALFNPPGYSPDPSSVAGSSSPVSTSS